MTKAYITYTIDSGREVWAVSKAGNGEWIKTFPYSEKTAAEEFLASINGQSEQLDPAPSKAAPEQTKQKRGRKPKN